MRSLVMAAALFLAACGEGSAPSEIEGNAGVADPGNETKSAAVEPKAAGGMAPCPFRETENWRGSSEGGRLLVTGTLDLQMAGMKPQLTERSAGGGTLALDLALVPEAGAAVTDQARYERSGAPRYSAGEIWCGGQRIARFDMINI